MEKLKDMFNKVKGSIPKLSEEEKAKKEKINKLLKEKPINIMLLREHCLSKYGLVDQQIRKIAWPLLLNIHQPVKVKDVNIVDETTTPKYLVINPDKEWSKDTNLDDTKMADQIVKDVNRSFNHYNLGMGINFYRK